EAPGGKVRTIAAIFSHVHNIRRKWVRLSAPKVKLPAELDRRKCTQKQAAAALGESAAQCAAVLRGLEDPGKRIVKVHRDGWARRWEPGVAMFGYMMTHDAHHRGQACLLAAQMGFPLPGKAAYGMWGWERLWAKCGFGRLA